MIEEGTAYFLSRTRRFGKSLFLDILTENERGLGLKKVPAKDEI
jgi:hypothetical protein